MQSVKKKWFNSVIFGTREVWMGDLYVETRTKCKYGSRYGFSITTPAEAHRHIMVSISSQDGEWFLSGCRSQISVPSDMCPSAFSWVVFNFPRHFLNWRFNTAERKSGKATLWERMIITGVMTCRGMSLKDSDFWRNQIIQEIMCLCDLFFSRSDQQLLSNTLSVHVCTYSLRNPKNGLWNISRETFKLFLNAMWWLPVVRFVFRFPPSATGL